jgi:glycosyltransferase involved in cell wall biosynthesis
VINQIRAVAAQTLLSIVVPTKNRPQSLRRLLESLQRQDYRPYEVIVVDDASDAPVSGLNGVSVIRREVSGGCGPARNDGIAAAHGAFIASFDDDCEITDPNLLTRAVEFLERYPRCGAVAFTQTDAHGCPWGGAQVTGSAVPCYAPNFFGFGHLLRAEAIRQVGGFVLDYYYEDVELSLRLWDARWSIIHDPSLAVVHHHDWQGRDWTALSRRILRNTILAALLRYPAWLVPMVVSQYARNHLQRSRAGLLNPHGAAPDPEARADWAGVVWALGGAAQMLPHVLHNRRPIRWETIQHWRRLRECPTPL